MLILPTANDISTHRDDVSPLVLMLLPVVMIFLFMSLQLYCPYGDEASIFFKKKGENISECQKRGTERILESRHLCVGRSA